MTDHLTIYDWFYTWIHIINSIFPSPLFYFCMSRILNGSDEDALFFEYVWSFLCFVLTRCCHVFSGQVPYLAFPVPAQSSDLEKMRHGWVNGKDGHWRKVNMPATKTSKVPRASIIYVDLLTILWHTPISLYSILYQSRLGLCGWVDQGHVWHRKICSKCCISWGLRRSPQMCAVTEVTCLMQATSVLPVQLCRWVSVEIANRISQDPIPTASRILQAGRVKDLESTCYVYIDLLHL